MNLMSRAASSVRFYCIFLAVLIPSVNIHSYIANTFQTGREAVTLETARTDCT